MSISCCSTLRGSVDRVIEATQQLHRNTDQLKAIAHHAISRLDHELEQLELQLAEKRETCREREAATKGWGTAAFVTRLVGTGLAIAAGGPAGAIAAGANLLLLVGERTGTVEKVARAADQAFPYGGLVVRGLATTGGLVAGIAAGGLSGSLPTMLKAAVGGSQLIAQTGHAVAEYRERQAQAELQGAEADQQRLECDRERHQRALDRWTQREQKSTEQALAMARPAWLPS